MVNGYVLLLVTGLFLFHIQAAVRADSASQAERQIQARYDNQDVAMGLRDLKASIAPIDSMYVRRGIDVTAESRKECVAEMSAWFAHKMSANYMTMVEKVRMVGPKTAFVIATHHANFGVMVAPNVPGEAVSTYTVHDKWIKRATGWMLIQTFEMRSPQARSRKESTH